MHTLMTHPSLKEHFKTVLVISPLNVIATWQEEISRWIEKDSEISAKLKVVYHPLKDIYEILRATRT